MREILKKLGIEQFNYGSCIGGNIWLETEDSGIIKSFNPSN